MKDENLVLHFSENNFPINEIHSFQFLRSESTIYSLYEFTENFLINWRFTNGTWVRQIKNYVGDLIQGRHVFSINKQKDIIVATIPQSICIYVCEEKDLYLCKSRCIHDFDWNAEEDDIMFGRFYYDPSKMGFFVIQENNAVNFYEIISRSIRFLYDKNTDKVKLLYEYCTKESKIMLAQLRKEPKQSVICRDDHGLHVFEFDFKNILKLFAKIRYGEVYIPKDNRIFFANLSGQEDWMDIVALNEKGLFVFRYEITTISYKLINYNPNFSEIKGWSERYTQTVRFIDFDNDGIDDMVFTGPGGVEIISYNFYTNKWKSLLNAEKLTVQERHTTILYALPPQRESEINNSMVFSYHSGSMHYAHTNAESAEMIHIPLINKQFPLSLADNTDVLKIKPSDNGEGRSIIYMRDQSVDFDYYNSVNPKTGKPSFALNLVGKPESTVKFQLHYDGSSNLNSGLGIGWSTPQNFITANHQYKNFKNDDSYLLVLENIPYELQLLHENSTSSKLVFQWKVLDVHSKEGKCRAAEFDIINNIWTLDIEDSQKNFYGMFEKNSGAINTERIWDNWYGLGVDNTDSKERVNMWYLAATNAKGVFSYYNYKVVKFPDSSNKFSKNSETILKSISSPFSNLTFSYSGEDQNSNRDSYILLSNYTYTTKTTEQTINFTYTKGGNSVLLTSIYQKSDYISNPVIQMEYSEPIKGRHLLERLILPSGNEIVYKYTPIGHQSTINEINCRKIPVSDEYIVSYGTGFTLISSLDRLRDKVVLRMFKNDMSEEIYPSINNQWPSLNASYNLETHEILTGNSFFVVVLYEPPYKSIFGFARHSNGNWIIPRISYYYDEETVVLTGETFILILNANKYLYLFEWISQKNEWKSTDFNIDHLSQKDVAVHNNNFVLYDDNNIYLGYNTQDKWDMKKLKNIPGYIRNTMNTLKKFELEMKYEQTVLRKFKNNTIQISHNLIVLSSLIRTNETSLATIISTFVIGKNLEVAAESKTIVEQDDLTKLVANVTINENGDKYTMKYFYENFTFKIQVLYGVNTSGKSKQEIDQDMASEMKLPAKRLLLNLNDYTVWFEGQIVECRNVKYFFGGAKWHRYEEEKNSTFEDLSTVQLDNRFVLSKAKNQSILKLDDELNNKREIFDFDTFRNFDDIQIRYPIYIAAQKDGEPVTIIEFTDTEEPIFTNTTLPKFNRLSPLGNENFLVTLEIDPRKYKTLNIWPIYGIRRYLPNFVINSVNVLIPGENGESRERMMGYKYEESDAELFADRIHYKQVLFYPGNNQISYGYIRIGNHSSEFFSGSNEFVAKYVYQESSGIHCKSSENESNKNTSQDLGKILLDRSGRFEIANFLPFSSENQMADYIGFEDYENPSNRWTYNKNDVVKGRFSLTGRNYLQLREKSMKGTFKPLLQDRLFVASCWIRTLTDLTAGDIVPHLRARIVTEQSNVLLNVLGDVKFQISDWSYLEVVLDLGFTHLALKLADRVQSNNLQVEIIVSTLPKTAVDVDHIRFSTLDHLFKVNVYDNDLGKIIAVIKSNGAITRNVYDEYQELIAEINESNLIKEFLTYTKNSYEPSQYNNPACKIRIIPEKGFYEDFSPIHFRKRWKLTNVDTWKISPSTLQHYTTQPGFLSLQMQDIDQKSYGIRFLYSLGTDSLFAISNSITIQYRHDLRKKENSRKQRFPKVGEILILKEGNRVIVWINGRLYLDKHFLNFNLSNIYVKGDVKIQYMIVFSRPQIQVMYKNALNEEIQKISLISSDTVVVTNILYDELGRQRIISVPVKQVRSPEESVMTYNADFVTNGNPEMSDSVWHTRKLKGKISEILEHEFGFSEIVYKDNPLKMEHQIGFPGEEFRASEKYGLKFDSVTSNFFVLKQYPPTKNYTYQVQLMPYGREIISIFNSNNLKIATYIHVEGERDRLSTFEYNQKGLMTKSLPPTYYDKYGKYNETNLNLIEIPQHNEQAEQKMEIRISYNEKDNTTCLTSPDKGPIEYVYDEEDKLRYNIQYFWHEPDKVESIIYFKYDVFGRLISIGSLKNVLEKRLLLQLNVTDNNSKEFQHFYHSYYEYDPAFRAKLIRSVTNYEDNALHEETILDSEDNVISKRYIYPNGSDKPKIVSINKWYEASRVKEILYPTRMFGMPLRVAYEYDKLGQIISVGIPGQLDRFLKMTYNARGQIATQTFLPLRTHQFIRSYKYNDPGFLIEIDDPFLSQEISYTNNGYRSRGYGDGTITRIKFTAKWHKMANTQGIGIHENSFENEFISPIDSQRCFQELKREGYLNDNNQQTNVFYPDLNVNLSFACTNGTMEQRVKEVLGQRGFPEEYGFRFDYGQFMELKKAKYFVGDIQHEPKAFEWDSFEREIKNISLNNSMEIWTLLRSNGYISEDIMGYGNLAIPLLRESLLSDLKAANPEYIKYAPLLKKLLLQLFSTSSQDVQFSQLETFFNHWFPNGTSHHGQIYDLLSRKMYFQNPIKSNFIQILAKFSKFIPEIVRVIQKYDAIGRAEFDMESIKTDANGNRLHFNEGFENYELTYEPNTNRIDNIKWWNSSNDSLVRKFQLLYNTRGSVINASHKGIWLMEYHRFSNCLQKVVMVNGKIILISYDKNGERVLKQVLNANLEMISEMHYFRDELGRILVERKVTYIAPNQLPDVLITSYIYGSKFLVGFVRRDQFYSVITDHQGSVRLIVRDGEVVAAYDYTPYGTLMRVFGNNPDTHIPYLYTGVEWDPDLGLYNYNARIYDPSIGRFYQVDPTMQYFNPYKYAGNSPVSAVDPSGKTFYKDESLILAIIVFSFIGSYLAAASVNDSFNPLKWDWTSSETKLAIIYGGTTGALIPIGYFTSVDALGGSKRKSAAQVTAVGLMFAKMNVAANNQGELNPIKWDYSSPKTWWYAFEGFSMGVGIVAGLHESKKIFLALTTRQKYIYGEAAITYGGVLLANSGNKTGWNVKRVDFWLGAITSIVSAPDLPNFGKNVGRFVKNHAQKIRQKFIENQRRIIGSVTAIGKPNKGVIDTLDKILDLLIELREVTKAGGKLLVGFSGFAFSLATVGMLVYAGSPQWDLTSLDTFHNLLTATHLTIKFFDITKVTVATVRPLETMHSRRLSDMIEANARMFAAVVADLNRHDWRHISVHPRITRQSGDRSVRESTYLENNSETVFLMNQSLITFVYTRNNYINPSYITEKSTEIMPLQQEVLFTRNLTIALAAGGETAKVDYQRDICNKLMSVEGISFEAFNSNNNMYRCEVIIQRLFRYNVNRAFITSSRATYTVHNNKMSAVESKLERMTSELASVKNKLKLQPDFDTQKKDVAKQFFLQIAIKNLKSYQLAIDSENIKNLSDILWNHFESYRDFLLRWQFTNRAEPPLMQPLNLENSKVAYLPNPSAYDSTQELSWLRSYHSEEVPQLQPFQKCYNCINTTSSIRNIVRDIGWLTMLNANFHVHEKSAKAIQRQRRSLNRQMPNFYENIFKLSEGSKKKRNLQSMFLNGFTKNVTKFCNRAKLLWSSISGENSSNSALHKNYSTLQFTSANAYRDNETFTSDHKNFLDFGAHLLHQMVSNENLLLAQVLLAKCRKRKMHKISYNLEVINLTQKQEFACEMVELYEKALESAARNFGIALDELDMSKNFFLYEEIVQNFDASMFDKISQLMTEYAWKVLLDYEERTRKMICFHQRQMFISFFKKAIGV